MNSQYIRLCPKDTCGSAVLHKGEFSSLESSFNSDKSRYPRYRLTKFSKRVVDMNCSSIAYPDTLLNLDSCFTNAEFAEEYCSNISTFL